MPRLNVQIDKLKCSNSQKKMIFNEAMYWLVQVVNNPLFIQKVKEYQHQYEKVVHDNQTYGKFEFLENYNPHYKRRYTNDEILELFQSGVTKFEESVDNALNFSVTVYYKKWTRVKGYTYPSTEHIWTNSKYWNQIEMSEIMANIIGNLVHEYMHNMGFGHLLPKMYWKHTVPYAYGYIAEEVFLAEFGKIVDASFKRKKYRRYFKTYYKWVKLA